MLFGKTDVNSQRLQHVCQTENQSTTSDPKRAKGSIWRATTVARRAAAPTTAASSLAAFRYSPLHTGAAWDSDGGYSMKPNQLNHRVVPQSGWTKQPTRSARQRQPTKQSERTGPHHAIMEPNRLNRCELVRGNSPTGGQQCYARKQQHLNRALMRFRLCCLDRAQLIAQSAAREGGYQCTKLNQQQRCTKDKENLREGLSIATEPAESSCSAAVRVGKTAPPVSSTATNNKTKQQDRPAPCYP